MRLLLDQNLSPLLIERLRDLYPDSVHVASVSLDRAMDEEIWRYALQHELAIVTKDADFSEMRLLRGSCPKVVWIRRGNCSTSAVETMLRHNHDELREFLNDEDAGVIELY